MFSNPASQSTRAAYEAARAAACNPDATGRCRGYAPKSSILSSIFPSSSRASAGSAGTFGALFFIAVITFIVFLVLVFIHYTMFPVFALSVNDPGLILIPTSSDRELSYKKDGAAGPTKRRDTDTGNADNKTLMPSCCNYTIGVDMFINGGLTPINYPNVVLYRDLKGSTVTGPDSVTKDTLNKKYTNTNIIIWLENDTNNLHITLVTIDMGLDEKLQDLPPIENVPLNKKFRLTVALADSFIEVYINGALEQSMQITGNLKGIGSITNSTDFYPPITSYEVGGVKISNMSMWPRVITSKEIRTYEAVPMSA